MEIISTSFVVIVGLLAGSMLGVASGFALAANDDVASGIEVTFRNPMLRWMFRRANNLTLLDSVLYLLFISASLPVLFALLLAPFLVGSWLSISESLSFWVSFGPLLAGMFFGKIVGRNL